MRGVCAVGISRVVGRVRVGCVCARSGGCGPVGERRGSDTGSTAAAGAADGVGCGRGRVVGPLRRGGGVVRPSVVVMGGRRTVRRRD